MLSKFSEVKLLHQQFGTNYKLKTCVILLNFYMHICVKYIKQMLNDRLLITKIMGLLEGNFDQQFQNMYRMYRNMYRKSLEVYAKNTKY